MTSVEQWWSMGQRVQIPVRGTHRTIFSMSSGAGPAMTLLHGFPSSSHDWARVLPRLAKQRSLLLLDFLGFGASEKPAPHDYSIHEQADLVEAIWAREGIAQTALVAHDYAVSVVQELLARRADGALSVDLLEVHFLNGGLYADVYRPQPGQLALLDAEQGPQISAQINEELWTTALAPTFADGFDAAADCAAIWHSMSRDDGHRIVHRLIQYMHDRELHSRRWNTAIESTDVPLFFVWGMLDPISGAHMAERIRERLPNAPFLALQDVSHWPSLEAPDRVAAAVIGSS